MLTTARSVLQRTRVCPALVPSQRLFCSTSAAAGQGDDIMIHDSAFPMASIACNALESKPRTSGLTEIRAAYYTPMTPTYLRELLEGMGHAVDGLKFAGGSFRVIHKRSLQQLIQIAHEHDVYVSTGGWMEYVLSLRNSQKVKDYLAEAKKLGFDVVELSTGFITLPEEDLHRLIRDVHNAGLEAKPEIGIQFGAGGASGASALSAAGQIDTDMAVAKAARCLEQPGVQRVMIESEGITEDVEEWRTDVAAKFVRSLGLERIMFEASEPPVFTHYIQQYGPRVNLFVDHSQIVQLECLRRGIWGTAGTWGRVLTHN